MIKTLNFNLDPSYFFLVCRSSCSTYGDLFIRSVNGYKIGIRTVKPPFSGRIYLPVGTLIETWNKYKNKKPYLAYLEHKDDYGNVIIKETYYSEKDFPTTPGRHLFCPECGEHQLYIKKKT